MSERVSRAVGVVAARVSAAAGQPGRPGVPERFRVSGVSPEEVGRRLLSGLVDVEDMGALLAHLDRRVAFLMATIECGSEEEHARMGASILMSEVQCVAVGLAFARDGENSAARVVERVEVRGVGMDAEVGPPAFDSFKASSRRPSHGGRPGPVEPRAWTPFDGTPEPGA